MKGKCVYPNPRGEVKRFDSKVVTSSFAKRFDPIGVSRRNATFVVGEAESTPTPGCFWPNVRKDKKIREIDEFAFGKTCASD